MDYEQAVADQEWRELEVWQRKLEAVLRTPPRGRVAPEFVITALRMTLSKTQRLMVCQFLCHDLAHEIEPEEAAQGSAEEAFTCSHIARVAAIPTEPDRSKRRKRP